MACTCRRTCALFLAFGLLFSTAFFFLLGTKAWTYRRYVSFQPDLRTRAVSSGNRTNSPRRNEAPGVNVNTSKVERTRINSTITTNPPGLSFNTSEVERMRKWVLKYFNPDTDLTVNKSQVQVGQTIRYEASRKESANITENFFRLIPESSPLLGRHFRSCAVVGNSGILLGSRCGPEIDSADFVFRSNLAAVDGFEKDVGAKSNFTTMNPSVLSHDYKGYGENSSMQVRFVKRLRLIQDQILHIPAFVSPNGREDVEFTNRMILENRLPIKLSYAPRDTTGRMKKLWNDSEFKPKRPSTGSIMFALAACLCDQMHLYGFYPFGRDEQGRKIGYHYYGKVRNLRNHNMTEEYRAFQRLHQRKALVLHTEPCDNVKL
ncbi:PREDICTED: CMP-N-acetylneuraminate-poly-alpha-2,8-sialyltransferase-like [Branchiostoma belcheri]|uniref:CMP-N-acetylneuraminate-poly-alpha-2, 8-sialyltransferase-like n=1 Tax=Branchiostoma belcheri TaxID=7741 RepID=A0A6P4YA53_BRABE|nr:PREDICTED: CMP-N-acetylneuraminate-poly-alpha-2,8-sialyltransferase-like [Branchiostoma belcheri]